MKTSHSTTGNSFISDFKRTCPIKNHISYYSNEESTVAFSLEPVAEEIIEERVEILEEIADITTKTSLEKMVGETIRVVLEGESDEHKYLLSARPTLWAKDIDGDILINDTGDLEILFGGLYEVKVTELVGDRLLGSLIGA